MNRTQAEHLLDAYTHMTYAKDAGGGSDASKAVESLRGVIIDAMCENEVKYYPLTVAPSKPWTMPTGPIVTWTGEDTLGNRSTWEGVNANAD